jgi:hypothetical protein
LENSKTEEIVNCNNMETENFLPFGDFYSEIRTHFSRNPQDFEELKRKSSGRKKIEYLLDHPVVQNSLNILSNRNKFKRDRKVEEVFEPSSNEIPISTKLDGFNGSAKYPQLSQKVLVQDSKKKGRHLVAKEKINPGEQTITLLNHR